MIPGGMDGDARYYVRHAAKLRGGVAFQPGPFSIFRWGIMVVRGSVRRRERGMIRKLTLTASIRISIKNGMLARSTVPFGFGGGGLKGMTNW
jgi:hypothetical protein